MFHKHQRPIVMLAILVVVSLVIFGLSTASAQGPDNQGTATPNCPHNRSTMNDHGSMMGMMNGQSGMNGMMDMMHGEMMGYHGSMMGKGEVTQFGPGIGMMGQWVPPTELQPTADKPLTVDTATKIAESYIAAWKSDYQLKLGSLLQFSNQYYGQVLEADTERGAFEFLIDPETGTVYSEHGPTMMWNLRYGMTMHLTTNANDSATLIVTPEKAREYAQSFLDQEFAGTKVADKLTPFYGYYTLNILKEGKQFGVLSVNGFTGQVWYHDWLGDLGSQIE